MSTPDPADYLSVNRRNWESRVPHHVAGYGLDAFHRDPAHLSGVVQFDRARLGDLTGLNVVHLQCHIGSDTVSLARLGANVTGLDFSPSALGAARELADAAGAEVRFVEADVYSALDVLDAASFDLVYTGIGALCWLPDVARWATVVASLLRPGGRLFIREGHPVLWSLGDRRDDGLLSVEYPYFETEQGSVFVETSTYVAHEGELSSPTTVQWNHGIGQIFAAVSSAGMTVTSLVEHDTIPWNPFGDQMVDVGGGEYRLVERPERVPMSYTLQARRDA